LGKALNFSLIKLESCDLFLILLDEDLFPAIKNILNCLTGLQHFMHTALKIANLRYWRLPGIH